MGKIIVAAVITLDGFVAGPDDEMDWLVVDDEIAEYEHRLVTDASALLLGRVTHTDFARAWPAIAADPSEPPTTRAYARRICELTRIVVSERGEVTPWERTVRLRGLDHDAVRQLRSELLLRPAVGVNFVLLAEGKAGYAGVHRVIGQVREELFTHSLLKPLDLSCCRGRPGLGLPLVDGGMCAPSRMVRWVPDKEVRPMSRRWTVPRRARGAVVEPMREFLRAESAGGIVLLAAAVLALAWANSPASGVYQGLWLTQLTLGTGPLAASHDLRGWVNDGLMVLFFFVIGLEIKRELVTGELRRPQVAVLPALAATGGVVLPAAIFVGIVGTGEDAAGWGIPVATDIAFAVGVLAVLGSRIPAMVKVFLVSVAIVDDIIAIVIIAVFYSESISLGWLGAAAVGLAVVVAMRRFGVRAIRPYALVGLGVWYATDSSGVHATIAGVVLGLLTPARPVRGREVLLELEHRLHPVTAFVVVPLFALANTGVDLRGGVLGDAAGSRVTWGVAAGLVVGKALGIAAVTLLAHRTRVASLPPGVSTGHVWGVAALAGIGFTVSLFITELAYADPALVGLAKVGIFAGSAVSAAFGVTQLMRATRRPRKAAR